MFQEVGIGRVDVFTVQQGGGPLGSEPGDEKAHGDAVVSETVQSAAAEFSSSVDKHAVVELDHVGAHSVQVGDNSFDAVALLHAEFRSVADVRVALSIGGSHGENRNFIDEVGNFFRTDIRAMKLRRIGDAQVAVRLTLIGLREDFDMGAHPLQNLDEVGTSGIETDAAKDDFATGLDAGGDHPESGRGEISRNRDVGRSKSCTPIFSEREPVWGQGYLMPEMGKHPFRMVARLLALANSCLSLRQHPCQ